jgi:exopolyphosphatase/guanosine-5'-triphosphate,3'-diphosphate pyrophosphatase
MSLINLQTLRELLVRRGHVDAFDLPGIKKERVPVMVGGLSVLIGLMLELEIERITTTNAGLRLGVLSDLELRANRHDRRDQAVLACMRRFAADEQRALRTAGIARDLYARLGAQSEQTARLLGWSAMLHEVGLAVSHTGAHKHAAYIIEHADLPGFTTGEQDRMATLVLGQKGNLRKIRAVLADQDSARAVLALRLAAVFLHAHVDAEEIGELKLQMKSRIEICAPQKWMARHPTLSSWLGKEREAWAEVDRPLSVRLV